MKNKQTQHNPEIDLRTEQINSIQIQRKKLEEEINEKPLIVKQKIEYILEKNKEVLKGNLLKIELLKTKAKAISTLGGFETIDNIFNEILVILNEEYKFSDNKEDDKLQKRQIYIENIIYKIQLISNNYWQIWDSNGKIIIETHNNFEKILLKEINLLKELGEEKIANTLLYDFYNSIGKKEKAEEFLKKNSEIGEIEDIKNYLYFISYNFTTEYNSLKTPEEKRKFKQKNLLNIEKEFSKYIKGDNLSTRHPELLKDLGEFFEKIDEPKRALEEYENGIESEYDDSYKLYGKIAELYFQNKLEGINLKIKYVTYAKKEGLEVDKKLPTDLEIQHIFISEFFRKLIYYAKAHKDNKTQIYGLERMGDLVKNQKTYGVDQFPKKTKQGTFSRPKNSEDYYNEAIELYLSERLKNEEDIYSFLRISNKAGLKYTKHNLSKLENKLLSGKNALNNYKFLAEYYNENGDLENACIHYLKGYEIYRINIENGVQLSKDEQKKLNSSFIKFLILLKVKEKNNEEGRELIDKIILKINNKKELASHEIQFIFSISLESNFEKNIDLNKIIFYINLYNMEDYSSHIYIQIVLKKLKKNKDLNQKFIEKLFSNIYKQENIEGNDTLTDLRLLFDEPTFTTIQKIEQKELPITEKFIKLIVENDENDETYIYEFISFLENELKIQIRQEISENNEKIYNLNKEKKEISKKESNQIMKKQLLKPIKNILTTASNNNEVLLEQLKEISSLIEELKLNKKISEQQVREIFNLSIDDNYYLDFDIQKLFEFITIYNNKIPFGDILLQNILLNLGLYPGFKDEKILLPFFTKINKNFPLTKEDKSDLIDIFKEKFDKNKQYRKFEKKALGIETEDDTNTFEYTILLSEIIKKSRK